MQLWQFSAAVMVSYLGLVAGFFLASMTREELPTAKKYLPWLEKLVVLAIAAVMMNLFGLNVAAKAAVYVLLLLFFVYGYNLKLVYAAFGAVIFAVSKDSAIFLATAALIFIFGLLSGSSNFSMKIRKGEIVKAAAKALLRNSFYPAVAVMLFLAFSR
ncbi:hypothetical protein HYU40_04785 [Candidatus Woesearchaeota archaeon]|nr:hypothetical protein [Candidatus Woesearchaeota archaeon]